MKRWILATVLLAVVLAGLWHRVRNRLPAGTDVRTDDGAMLHSCG